MKPGNLFFFCKERILFYSFFSLLYVLSLIFNIYYEPFELVADLQNYHNHFYTSGVFIYGFELVIPLAFNILRFLGLGFYDFVFFLGLFYLAPILMMANLIKTRYLVFYFLFYLLYHMPNYAFLMRQYFAFYTFVLFLLSRGHRSSYFFLILSFFSHGAALIWISIFFLRRVMIFPFIGLVSIFLYFLSLYGYSLLGVFGVGVEILSAATSMPELSRKLHGMLTYVDHEGGSRQVYFVLCLAVLLHSIYMAGSSFGARLMRHDSLLCIMFFSSCLALAFADSAVISNRLGFAGYFFSLPYLFMVMSRFIFTSSFKLRREPPLSS